MKKQKNPFPVKRKSKKKVIIIAVIVVALLLAAGSIWYVKANRDDNTIRPENTVDYSPATPDDNQAAEEQKGTTSSGQEDKPGTNDGQAPTAPVDFSVTVTGANADPANKIARVSTLVNGATAGTCVVTFTQTGQAKVIATNEVTLQTNSYVCPNFTIPYSQFPAGGAWNVSVAVTHNNKTVTGTWQGGAITIQK